MCLTAFLIGLVTGAASCLVFFLARLVMLLRRPGALKLNSGKAWLCLPPGLAGWCARLGLAK